MNEILSSPKMEDDRTTVGTDDAMVRIEKLHFRRGSHSVFNGFDAVIPRGKITAVMGPSGTGKTTLLKLIGGQIKPDSGAIWVDGERVDRLSRRRLYRLRARMSLLFQSGALLTDLDVFENVAFPLRENMRLPEPVLETLVLMKLEAVGLRGAARLRPSELSGGMARRVALARSLAFDPELMLYDEPFTGLDPITMGQIVRLIRETHEALSMTSVLVTHDVPEALSIADHLIVMAEGRVIDQGSVADVQARANDWTTQFLAGEADGPVPFHYPAPAYYDELGLGLGLRSVAAAADRKAVADDSPVAGDDSGPGADSLQTGGEAQNAKAESMLVEAVDQSEAQVSHARSAESASLDLPEVPEPLIEKSSKGDQVGSSERDAAREGRS